MIVIRNMYSQGLQLMGKEHKKEVSPNFLQTVSQPAS